jgi:hypothetical protein
MFIVAIVIVRMFWEFIGYIFVLLKLEENTKLDTHF